MNYADLPRHLGVISQTGMRPAHHDGALPCVGIGMQKRIAAESEGL